MKTVGELLSLAAQWLQERGVAAPRFSAERLLSWVLHISRLDLYLRFDQPLEPAELDQFRALLARRGKGEPVDYILGEVDFLDCTLAISPAVLIPRPETEILVAEALACLAPTARTVWDIATGSGSIGIAVQKQRPDLTVSISDLSPEALAIARSNAARNGVEVECLLGDLFAPFAGRKTDVLFCNPPYIAEQEYAQLSREVREFEPRGALVGGEDGLLFYRRLAAELPSYLNLGAQVFLEIGEGQGAALRALFAAPCWSQCEIKQDWAGHDRFVFLQLKSC